MFGTTECHCVSSLSLCPSPSLSLSTRMSILIKIFNWAWALSIQIHFASFHIVDTKENLNHILSILGICTVVSVSVSVIIVGSEHRQFHIHYSLIICHAIFVHFVCIHSIRLHSQFPFATQVCLVHTVDVFSHFSSYFTLFSFFLFGKFKWESKCKIISVCRMNETHHRGMNVRARARVRVHTKQHLKRIKFVHLSSAGCISITLLLFLHFFDFAIALSHLVFGWIHWNERDNMNKCLKIWRW